MAAEDQNRGVPDPEGTARERSFDELARGLANGTISRGQALKWMGSALLGGALAYAGTSLIPKGETSAQAQASCAVGTHPCPGGGCVEIGRFCMCPNCPADTHCCPDGTCVEQARDCGASAGCPSCNCPEGTHFCPNGVCVSPGVNCPVGEQGCLEGEIRCTNTCVNPLIDPNNCGACGNTCNALAGEICSNGQCVVPETTQPPCPPGTFRCTPGGQCISYTCPSGEGFNHATCQCEPCPSGVFCVGVCCPEGTESCSSFPEPYGDVCVKRCSAPFGDPSLGITNESLCPLDWTCCSNGYCCPPGATCGPEGCI